jgi:hypothetical protein
LTVSENIEHIVTKEYFMTHTVPVEVYANSSFNITFSFLVFGSAVELNLKCNATYYSYIFLTLFSPIRRMMKGKEEEDVKVGRKAATQH